MLCSFFQLWSVEVEGLALYLSEYVSFFDSVSCCLSKGLGAPVGSLLLGNAAFIKKAKRFRKVMGGGMRQAGLLAAAGLFALKNNVERLKIDNDRAKELGASLEIQDYVQAVRPVKSNIVIFDLKIKNSAEEFLNRLKAHGILASAFGPSTIRFVLHLDVSSEMHEKVLETIKSI